MAYDEGLLDRIRVVLAKRGTRVEEKKMFGGMCFLVGGNMSCGIVGDELMLRVGADAYDAALAKPHARPMDFTGRPMRGMVYVGTAGIRTQAQLGRWLEMGLAFAESLPPKRAKPGARKPVPSKKRPARKAAAKKATKKKKAAAKARKAKQAGARAGAARRGKKTSVRKAARKSAGKATARRKR